MNEDVLPVDPADAASPHPTDDDHRNDEGAHQVPINVILSSSRSEMIIVARDETPIAVDQVAAVGVGVHHRRIVASGPTGPAVYRRRVGYPGVQKWRSANEVIGAANRRAVAAAHPDPEGVVAVVGEGVRRRHHPPLRRRHLVVRLRGRDNEALNKLNVTRP